MTNDEAAAKVSIILPTLKSPCIWCSLVHLSLTTSMTRELIIVADKPDVNRMNIFHRFRASTIIVNTELVGGPHAFNQGMRLATRPYIMVLNDDILPMTADWLVPLVSALDAHPEFGMVAPRVLRPFSEEKLWYAALGEGSLMTRAMIDRVGYFDESPEYAGLGTDGDYYARCMKAGYKFHGIPQSLIAHNCGQTIGNLLTEEYTDIVAKKLKAKWGDLPDQHLLPEYVGG